MVSISGVLAGSHARKVISLDRQSNLLAAFVGLLALALLIGIISPHLRFFPFLFHPATLKENLIGPAVAIGGFLLGIAVILTLVRAMDWLRHLRGSGRLLFFLFVAVASTLLAPEIGTHTKWVPKPHSSLGAAFMDGLFVGGVTFAGAIVGAFFLAACRTVGERRSSWDDPHFALLHSLLHAANRTLPTKTGRPESVVRVLEAVLPKEPKFSKEKEITSQLGRIIGIAKKDPANQGIIIAMWQVLFRAQKGRKRLPSFVKPTEEFLWTLCPKSSVPQWPQCVVMSALAADLRKSAAAVSALAKRLRTGDKVRDQWLRNAAQERANYILDLQRWVILPRSETRASLQGELRNIIYTVWQSDWGNLPQLAASMLRRQSWLRRGVNVAKSLVVALLPLATVVALTNFAKGLNVTVAGTLWTVAFVWLAVSLLTLLDAQFSDKLSALRDLHGLWKGTDDNNAKTAR